MFRHQQRGPGRGEQDAHHHDEGVDGADAAPEQQVTTPSTHSPPLSLSLSLTTQLSLLAPAGLRDMFPLRTFLMD